MLTGKVRSPEAEMRLVFRGQVSSVRLMDWVHLLLRVHVLMKTKSTLCGPNLDF